MKAIQVKFLPVTNTRPARLKAFTDTQTLIISTYDERLLNNSVKSLQLQAAELLATQYNWLNGGTTLAGGQIKNGDHVFVFVEK